MSMRLLRRILRRFSFGRISGHRDPLKVGVGDVHVVPQRLRPNECGQSGGVRLIRLAAIKPSSISRQPTTRCSKTAMERAFRSTFYRRTGRGFLAVSSFSPHACIA